MRAQVLAAPFSVQQPANVPGKSAKDGSCAEAPVTPVEQDEVSDL